MVDAQHLSYEATAAFSPLVMDYLHGHTDLQPFYSLRADIQGIRQAIENKKGKVKREVLVKVLEEQYKDIKITPLVASQIQSLAAENTFTVCTAHQPNLATGPLYVIYKILHVIRLAAELKKQLPEFDFVPVYYMGSEDADKDEVHHFHIHGRKYEWQTNQSGAVGRMKADKQLVALLDELERQVGVWPHGKEWAGLLRDAYRAGETIERSMLRLVNALFGQYGLVVLIADHLLLKEQMRHIFAHDLFTHGPSQQVADTCNKLSERYHIQAHPREINLFYLDGDVRGRIEKKGDQFEVHDTDIQFTETEIRKLLEEHPEKFSPNVILRGIFQETILPNIAFVGGGGEIAYWLQLKNMFVHYGVDFPILVLRNSFLLIEPHQQELIDKLSLPASLVFKDEISIMNGWLEQNGKKPALNGELQELETIYEQLRRLAVTADQSLGEHVQALKKRSVDKLLVLQNKMLRAERKKHEAAARQISRIKKELFPNGNLQERVENLGSYYAKYGAGIVDVLLQHSLALEQQFTVLRISS